MRGTDARPVAGLWDTGITPACAGNRLAAEEGGSQQEDHPRVCGEQLLWGVGRNNMEGSPPRVRGTGDLHFVVKIAHGITPACAGNRKAAAADRLAK